MTTLAGVVKNKASGVTRTRDTEQTNYGDETVAHTNCCALFVRAPWEAMIECPSQNIQTQR